MHSPLHVQLHAIWQILCATAGREFGEANGGRVEDSACFYVGQCFQISLRLMLVYVCEKSTECAWGGGGGL